MKTKLIVMLLIYLSVSFICNAQNTHKIKFDKTGKWIGGFESTIAKGDEILFIVEDDKMLVNDSLETSKKINLFKKDNLRFNSLSKEYPILKDLFIENGTTDSTKFNKFVETFPLKVPNDLSKLYKIDLKVFSEEPDCKKNVSFYLKHEMSTDECGNKVNIFTAKYEAVNSFSKIEFKLTKENIDNQFIAEYFKQTRKQYYDYSIYKEKIQTLNEILTDDLKKISTLLKEDTITQFSKDCKLSDYKISGTTTEGKINIILGNLKPTKSSLANVICLIIDRNKEWLKNWLWFNNGQPSFNPFFISMPNQGLQATNKNIELYQKQIDLLNQYIKNPSNEDFKVLKDELVTLNNALKKEQSVKSEIETYNKALANLSESSNSPYIGTIFGSTPKKITWMHHFDASKEFNLSNKKKSLPEWISEKDEVAVLTNNLDKKAKIKLESTITKAELKTSTEIGLSAFFDVLDIASISKADASAIVNSLDISAGSSNVKTDPDAILRKELQEIAELYKKTNWLISQTIPFKEIKLEANKDTVLYSKYSFPNELQAENKTFRLNYELKLNDKTDAVAKGSYKKYELIRFWPAAGIAFVNQDRFVSVYEDGAFKEVAKDINSVEPIIGVKIYPFKTNIVYRYRTQKLTRLQNFEGYNVKRGNNILNRITFFAGMGATKRVFLNYYLGIGLDVIPGINIQFGKNVYFQKKYVIENSKVVSSASYPNWDPSFVSISFDQGIISKLIKIF